MRVFHPSLPCHISRIVHRVRCFVEVLFVACWESDAKTEDLCILYDPPDLRTSRSAKYLGSFFRKTCIASAVRLVYIAPCLPYGVALKIKNPHRFFTTGSVPSFKKSSGHFRNPLFLVSGYDLFCFIFLKIWLREYVHDVCESKNARAGTAPSHSPGSGLVAVGYRRDQVVEQALDQPSLRRLSNSI